MIHYITVHFRSTIWIKPQLEYIVRYTNDFKVWAIVEDFPEGKWSKHFHFCDVKKMTKAKSSSNRHWRNLNILTKIICSDPKTKDDDILIWLDSDSLVINPVNNYVSHKLESFGFCAVMRIENNEEMIPHPSFAFSTVGFWKKHTLSWCGMERHNGKISQTDTGGKIWNYFRKRKMNWYRMTRTRSLTDHPVLFTIYDDIVYHHGSGTRKNLLTRFDPKVRSDQWKQKRKDLWDSAYNKVVNEKIFLNN